MTEERFIIEVLDKNNWLIEDIKTGETANPVDGTTNVLKGLISTLNKFNDENEQLKYQLSQQEMEYATDLHRLSEENEQLKKRNNNQYNQLTELWQIIEEENWEKLIEMKKQLKEDEERLRKEWGSYEWE